MMTLTTSTIAAPAFGLRKSVGKRTAPDAWTLAAALTAGFTVLAIANSPAVTGPRAETTNTRRPTPSLETLPLPLRATISRLVGRDDASYHVVGAPGSLRVTNVRQGLSAGFTAEAAVEAAGIGIEEGGGVDSALKDLTPLIPAVRLEAR